MRVMKACNGLCWFTKPVDSLCNQNPVKGTGEWLRRTRGKDCTAWKGLLGRDTVNTRQKGWIDMYFLTLFLFYGCQIPERDTLHWMCHWAGWAQHLFILELHLLWDGKFEEESLRGMLEQQVLLQQSQSLALFENHLTYFLLQINQMDL